MVVSIRKATGPPWGRPPQERRKEGIRGANDDRATAESAGTTATEAALPPSRGHALFFNRV